MSQETIMQFLGDYFEQRSQELALTLGVQVPEAELARTPMATWLTIIAAAAAGECPRSDSDYLSDSCQSVLEALFASPGQADYSIPAAFWQTPIGQMLSLAYIWLEQDELITIGEAARLSGKSISTISSRVQRGTLRSYPDPHAPNPRRAALLVRRRDIEAA